MIMAPALQRLKRQDYGGLVSQFQSQEKINLEAVGRQKQSCCRFSSPPSVNTDGALSFHLVCGSSRTSGHKLVVLPETVGVRS